MSDKRKPKYTILLKKEGNGKSNKIELFPASLWTDVYRLSDNLGRDRFRIRVNGKWWPEGKRKFITKTEVKELLFKEMES